jgi:hypothetical protein
MPDEALESVLRLVADGRLTAEEAAPILDALDRQQAGPGSTDEGASDVRRQAERMQGGALDGAPSRAIRFQVTERGRSVVNLRIPLSLGRAALSQVPGISEATSDRIREAISAGIKGPIVEVDDGGDGVRISIE